MASSDKPRVGSKPAAVAGIQLAAVASGSRYTGRDDLVLIEIAAGSTTSLTCTTNRFCAAPITICKRHLAECQPQYLIINAGNANAGTGEAGEHAATAVCAGVAETTGCPIEAVLPFSTGVIGEQLDSQKLVRMVPELLDRLSPANWHAAAAGILTTDTRPKICSAQVEVDGNLVTVTGMAKGSGMIKPNMATMLAYVVTDAKLGQQTLDEMVKQIVARSFNCITVDGDTSTNDALAVIATGASGEGAINIGSCAYSMVYDALEAVCIELAKECVRDGEGATKFVEVRVSGGEDESACRKVAYTVAESPLVKTALFASDPNWGRILAAVGRAPDVNFDLANVSIDISGYRLIEAGEPLPNYDESAVATLMEKDEIEIDIVIGPESTQAVIWTCDFSYDYVRINAEYRS